MLQSTTRWMRVAYIAVLLVGTPAVLPGCSGGSAASRRVSSAFDLRVMFSDSVGFTSPSQTRFISGTGERYSQAGYEAVNASLGTETNTNVFQLRLGKSGLLAVGDTFDLTPNSVGIDGDHFSYNDGNDTYIAQSGTLTINSFIERPEAGSLPALTIVTFTLANVKLQGVSHSNITTTLNGMGKITVQSVSTNPSRGGVQS